MARRTLDNGVRDDLVAGKHLRPPVRIPLRAHDCAFPRFGPPFEYLERDRGLDLVGGRRDQEVVDDKQIDPLKPAHRLLELRYAAPFEVGELIEHGIAVPVLHFVAVAGGYADRLRQIRLAGRRRPEDEHVEPVLDEREAGELLDDARRRVGPFARVAAVRDVLRAPEKPSPPQARGQPPRRPFVVFRRDDRPDEVYP